MRPLKSELTQFERAQKMLEQVIEAARAERTRHIQFRFNMERTLRDLDEIACRCRD